MPYAAIGRRIRQQRESMGLSRQDIATRLKVHVSSLVGWEQGRRLPREQKRLRLAKYLGSDVDSLFATRGKTTRYAFSAVTMDAVEEIPGVLAECTRNCQKSIRAVRYSANNTTPAFQLTEWRQLVNARLLDGSIEMLRTEIFCNLERLQEVLSNVFRYDGKRYFVKGICPRLTETLPFMGFFFLDHTDYILCCYQGVTPPFAERMLRVSGAPFQDYFDAYWDTIWRRGDILNFSGTRDLSKIKEMALKLGLKENRWKDFVEQARAYEAGDGYPPLT
jgi:transcriptional regulator with XRE-family HTH domain